MNDFEANDGSFVPHEVVWDDRKIARYWDHLSRLPAALSNCWSKQVGSALLQYVSRMRALQGRVLDYGCGPGFLIDDLLRMAPEATVYGIEYSPASVRLVEQAYSGRNRFGGVSSASSIPTGFSAGFFDVVFFVETIEHIRAAARPQVLREVRRLLRPGGLVVVTTPNEEDLNASRATCPDCGAMFHVVQHLSSWSPASLQSVMEDAGFQTVSCAATHLRLRRSPFLALRDLFKGRRLPHLIYVGAAS